MRALVLLVGAGLLAFLVYVSAPIVVGTVQAQEDPTFGHPLQVVQDVANAWGEFDETVNVWGDTRSAKQNRGRSYTHPRETIVLDDTMARVRQVKTTGPGPMASHIVLSTWRPASQGGQWEGCGLHQGVPVACGQGRGLWSSGRLRLDLGALTIVYDRSKVRPDARPVCLFQIGDSFLTGDQVWSELVEIVPPEIVVIGARADTDYREPIDLTPAGFIGEGRTALYCLDHASRVRFDGPIRASGNTVDPEDFGVVGIVSIESHTLQLDLELEKLGTGLAAWGVLNPAGFMEGRVRGNGVGFQLGGPSHGCSVVRYTGNVAGQPTLSETSCNRFNFRGSWEGNYYGIVSYGRALVVMRDTYVEMPNVPMGHVILMGAGVVEGRICLPGQDAGCVAGASGGRVVLSGGVIPWDRNSPEFHALAIGSTWAGDVQLSGGIVTHDQNVAGELAPPITSYSDAVRVWYGQTCHNRSNVVTCYQQGDARP